MNSSPSYADLVQAGFPLDMLVQEATHHVHMVTEWDHAAPSGQSILTTEEYECVGEYVYTTYHAGFVDMWSCEEL